MQTTSNYDNGATPGAPLPKRLYTSRHPVAPMVGHMASPLAGCIRHLRLNRLTGLEEEVTFGLAIGFAHEHGTLLNRPPQFRC